MTIVKLTKYSDGIVEGVAGVEGNGLVVVFHKFIGVFDYKTDVLLIVNMKTWVINMSDAQRHHYEAMDGKAPKYSQNTLFYHHHDNQDITSISGLEACQQGVR